MTQTPSTVPVIGSTTEYTITCDVTVSCTGPCNDTLTISWSLNGNNINSATLIESNNSSLVLSGDNTTFVVASTLTTFNDISLSHVGQYQCNANLITARVRQSNTTDFDVKCTSSITTANNRLFIYFDSTCPFNYCY